MTARTGLRDNPSAARELALPKSAAIDDCGCLIGAATPRAAVKALKIALRVIDDDNKIIV
jgi:hypothetical protein